jgi:hypothetical protein
MSYWMDGEWTAGSGPQAMNGFVAQTQAWAHVDPYANPYIRRTCSYCGDRYYVFAMQNTMTYEEPIRATMCDYCQGKVSASEQSFRTEAIESQYGGGQ